MARSQAIIRGFLGVVAYTGHAPRLAPVVKKGPLTCLITQPNTVRTCPSHTYPTLVLLIGGRVNSTSHLNKCLIYRKLSAGVIERCREHAHFEYEIFMIKQFDNRQVAGLMTEG